MSELSKFMHTPVEDATQNFYLFPGDGKLIDCPNCGHAHRYQQIEGRLTGEEIANMLERELEKRGKALHKQTACEQDPAKLSELLKELNKLVDERYEIRKRRRERDRTPTK